MKSQFTLDYYKVSDYSDLEELSVIKADPYEDQHFKFIYDRSTNCLSLTGNYATAIFNFSYKYTNTNINSLSDIVKVFTNDTFIDNVQAFADNCVISSESHYVYNEQLARKQINRWLHALGLSNLRNLQLPGYPNYESLINDIIYHIDYVTGFDHDDDCMRALAEIDPDVYYGPITWGKQVNPVFENILQALVSVQFHTPMKLN